MPKVIPDTHAAAEQRRRSNARADDFLRKDSRERARFRSTSEMLSWFFALKDHMASVPAIDPSAEVIQGLRVDRDERSYWIQSVRQALEHMVRAQGNSTGALLLWLHLRPRKVVGYKVKKGINRPIYSEPVPVWELFREPVVVALQLGLSQRKGALGLLGGHGGGRDLRAQPGLGGACAGPEERGGAGVPEAAMSETGNEGGGAFPRAGSTWRRWRKDEALPGGGEWVDQSGTPEDGMSLRDYFAAKAMGSILSNTGWVSSIYDGLGTAEEAHAMMCHTAYLLADAMLAERAKEKK
jgi:hypothetical protein